MMRGMIMMMTDIYNCSYFRMQMLTTVFFMVGWVVLGSGMPCIKSCDALPLAEVSTHTLAAATHQARRGKARPILEYPTQGTKKIKAFTSHSSSIATLTYRLADSTFTRVLSFSKPLSRYFNAAGVFNAII